MQKCVREGSMINGFGMSLIPTPLNDCRMFWTFLRLDRRLDWGNNGIFYPIFKSVTSSILAKRDSKFLSVFKNS